MGRWKEKPKYNVFSLRTDDDFAEQIREGAKGYESMQQFLHEAVEEKLQGLSFDRQADSL